MSTRREFFRSLKLLSLGLLVPSAASKANVFKFSREKKVGVQLYSFRDIIRADIPGTLSAISKMGFSGIESWGYDGKFFGIPAREFKAICSDLGLEIYSTHTGITEANAVFYCEQALEAGMEYLILPSMMGRPVATIADYQRVAEEMNRIGEICNQHEVRFAYHNHDFEFRPIDGVLPYDILLMETEPGLVSFQADTYFFAKLGLNPIDFFKNYPGRFSSLHLKDLGLDGQSCIIGNGVVDFKAIMDNQDLAGTKLLIYEQESCAEGSMLYCAEQSIRYIHTHLLH
jgi:sugar phosphate isomerase/epimerase